MTTTPAIIGAATHEVGRPSVCAGLRAGWTAAPSESGSRSALKVADLSVGLAPEACSSPAGRAILAGLLDEIAHSVRHEIASGRPAARRSRIMLEEIARAGISMTLTRAWTGPGPTARGPSADKTPARRERSKPGRVAAMRCTTPGPSAESFQVRMSSTASAPVTKKICAPGRHIRGDVFEGVDRIAHLRRGRSQRRDTENRGWRAMATADQRYRNSAGSQLRLL